VNRRRRRPAAATPASPAWWEPSWRQESPPFRQPPGRCDRSGRRRRKPPRARSARRRGRRIWDVGAWSVHHPHRPAWRPGCSLGNHPAACIHATVPIPAPRSVGNDAAVVPEVSVKHSKSGRPDLNRGPHRGGRDTVRARAGPRPAREEIGAPGSSSRVKWAVSRVLRVSPTDCARSCPETSPPLSPAHHHSPATDRPGQRGQRDEITAPAFQQAPGIPLRRRAHRKTSSQDGARQLALAIEAARSDFGLRRSRCGRRAGAHGETAPSRPSRTCWAVPPGFRSRLKGAARSATVLAAAQ
jgi:hypothetical protein